MDTQKLGELLSSPELIEAAAKLAGELLARSPADGGSPGADAGASVPTNAPAASDGPPPGAGADGEAASPSPLSGGAAGGIPISPAALSAVLGMLGGAAPPDRAGDAESAAAALAGAPGEGRRAAPSSSPGPDPKLLSTALQVFGAFGRDDDRVRLLRALKPLLRDEKAEKIDRAVRILKVSTAIRAAINSLAGGGKSDVLKI